MAKNIIFCADGTWNSPTQNNDGVPDPTNVDKFAHALIQSDIQTAKYDDGVGADGTLFQHWLGGAIGDGLFTKIKDGYNWIAEVYENGDSIYLFGFSRGAYTARSLAGMIATCGLPAEGKYASTVASDVFATYRSDNREVLLQELQHKYANRNVDIAMVGVWDTVGALGIPGGLFEGFDSDIYGFLDTKLHPNIKSAYHALAIDEHRPLFSASLWDDDIQQDQELKQVWFAGVHSDVGGGYPETALSDIPLGWMMKAAKAEGALFHDDAYAHFTRVDPYNFTATAHESWSVIAGPRAYRPIPIRSDIRMASSVVERWKKLTIYRPQNAANILGAPVSLLETEMIA